MSAQPNPTGTSGTHTAGASTDAPHIEHTVGTLLKQLMREVPALLTNEIALAKSELRENMQQTKAGMASVATDCRIALRKTADTMSDETSLPPAEQ